VDQLGHFEAVGPFFHVDQEAERADGIVFECLHDSIPTEKEGCMAIMNTIQSIHFSPAENGVKIKLITRRDESSFIAHDSENQRHLVELFLHDEFLRPGRNERQFPFAINPRHEGHWKHSESLF
jgi:hypothetical protein